MPKPDSNKSIGSFCLIKNEARWIKQHIIEWLPYLSQMVFFDGNSTDGTTEIIAELCDTHELGERIKLVRNKDPKDLKEDYQKLSNEAMWAVDCDLAIFLHPDMFPLDISKGWGLTEDTIAGVVSMVSYAGEPGNLYRIDGRGEAWKNIYRLRNPNLGAHYHGFYGAQNEDTYFSEITGSEYVHYGTKFSCYPYQITQCPVKIAHFSDVRPYERRLDRMIKCLRNQGYSDNGIQQIAQAHPRVSLKDGAGFKFESIATPPWLH